MRRFFKNFFSQHKYYKFCKHKIKKCNIHDKLSYLKYKNKVIINADIEFSGKLNKIEKQQILNLITCESGQNPFIVSIDSGYGLFQLTKTKNKCLNTNCNIKSGLKHLKKVYKKTKKLKFVNYYIQYNKNLRNYIIWQYTFRAYNGGFKYLNNLENQITSQNKDFITSIYVQENYCFTYKISKRFICFEKINAVYPYKIMFLTSDFKNLN